MRSNQKSQLLLRIEQIGQESTGLSVRQKAKEEELEWIGQELSRVRNLSQQQLVQFNRLAELERLRAQLRGERGQFIAESAKLAALVTETKLQILQLEQNHLTEVVTELRDIDNKLSELRGQRIAAEDTLKRMSITAPQSGIVHELAVYTIGGVIANGETIMQIVPNDDKFVVEARILPNDIDQIFIGQKATLRFSAFNQRTTPEIFGEVRTVSADLSQNQITGESWYTVRLSMRAEELEHLGNLPLHAGMPVDAFIQTGERTALSYLIKPLEDQISRAFKEE
jgi:HlyD family secretion protein